MLEAPPPQEDESKETPTLSSHNASRSSTPSVSHFDGTPFFLLPNAHLPSRHRTSISPEDMAIKPVLAFPEDQPKPNPTAKAASDAESAVKDSPIPPEDLCPLPLEEASQEPVSRPLPSLGELARLVRLEKYQSRGGCHIQERLYQAQIAAARTSRLLSIARSAQQTLAECIRSEDKQSFTSLYSVFRDAASVCLEPCYNVPGHAWDDVEDSAGYPDSFIDALPSAQKSALLEFLASIRGDRCFVADRLSLLAHQELLALLPDRNASKSNESVFDSSVRSASRASRNLGYVVDSQTDQLTTLEPTSPLEVLIQSTRSLDKELQRDVTAAEIWSTVCARLVSDQKRGMGKVVPTIIDIWSSSIAWPGKNRLEAWIGRTLQDGAFILEQPSRHSFRVRIQGRQDPNAEEEMKVEAFYSKAIHSLLELLADPNGASVVPYGALTLCRQIASRILSLGQREAFCKFVLTRWLFNSFIASAVTLPESYAMATDRYISDNARQRILREVVLRTQKVVAEVVHPWKYTSPVSPELASTVHVIASRFQAPTSSEVPLASDDEASSGRPYLSQDNPGLVAVSLSDVNILIDALYPQRRPPSLTSDSDVARSGLHSSSSSVSGFSLFPTPNSSSTTLAYPFTWPNDAPKPVVPYFFDSANAEPDSMASTDFRDVQSPGQMEARRLQDVRASVEDLVVSGRFPSDRQLAIICCDCAGRSGVTQAMRLRDVSAMADNLSRPTRAAHGISSTDHDFCVSAFREFLLDLDEPDGSPAIQAAQVETAKHWLLRALHGQVRRAKDCGHFVLAHSYLAMLARCERLFYGENADDLIHNALLTLKDSAESSLERNLKTIQECEGQFKVVHSALNWTQNSLQDSLHRCDLLRDKMLYTADVRTSGAYDEVRSIASALNIMGKPKKPVKSRMAPPLRHWSGSKISSSNLHLKTEAQVLELLSASADHGGPNKLSDDQSKALITWLGTNAVENLCIGEERLQKLCMEIRKAVDHLTAEASPLWSSSLFSRDRPLSAAGQYPGATGSFWSPPTPSRFDVLRLHTNGAAARDAWSSTASSHPLSARSSRDYLDTQSPTLTSRSSAPFWSPSMSEAMSPSSATSVGSSHTQAGFARRTTKHATLSKSRQDVLADTRKQITSLLLSEVTATMFNDGSETDQAFWMGLGGEMAQKHFCTLQTRFEDVELDLPMDQHTFNFQEAFETLISRFNTSCAPTSKLGFLVELDTLLGLHEPTAGQRRPPLYPQRDSQPPRRDTRLPISDSKIHGFRKLFCDRRTRPAAVFRDLQYIAALIPSIAIEYSARSMAFWHASLAIIGLKREVRSIMVETADSIIDYHSTNRGHGRAASTAQQQRDSATFPTTSQTPPAEDIAKYSMADAAHLLQITAKEGSPVAQRELATLYLTNPELMDHIIAPLARPKEVFKEELESKWRKNQDPARCDPVTMCVAHHWMSLSAKGGDALAKEYLKQREEMERLP